MSLFLRLQLFLGTLIPGSETSTHNFFASHIVDPPHTCSHFFRMLLHYGTLYLLHCIVLIHFLSLNVMFCPSCRLIVLCWCNMGALFISNMLLMYPCVCKIFIEKKQPVCVGSVYIVTTVLPISYPTIFHASSSRRVLILVRDLFSSLSTYYTPCGMCPRGYMYMSVCDSYKTWLQQGYVSGCILPMFSCDVFLCVLPNYVMQRRRLLVSWQGCSDHMQMVCI